MSIASAHASKFYEQVVRERRVFTLVEHDSFLVFPIHDIETIPFWSSRSRAERIQELHPRYRPCEVTELALDEFLNSTIPELEEAKIHFGVNWSGKRMTGYDCSAQDLLRNLQYWIERLGIAD